MTRPSLGVRTKCSSRAFPPLRGAASTSACFRALVGWMMSPLMVDSAAIWLVWNLCSVGGSKSVRSSVHLLLAWYLDHPAPPMLMYETHVDYKTSYGRTSRASSSLYTCRTGCTASSWIRGPRSRSLVGDRMGPPGLFHAYLPFGIIPDGMFYEARELAPDTYEVAQRPHICGLLLHEGFLVQLHLGRFGHRRPLLGHTWRPLSCLRFRCGCWGWPLENCSDWYPLTGKFSWPGLPICACRRGFHLQLQRRRHRFHRRDPLLNGLGRRSTRFTLLWLGNSGSADSPVIGPEIQNVGTAVRTCMRWPTRWTCSLLGIAFRPRRPLKVLAADFGPEEATRQYLEHAHCELDEWGQFQTRRRG